MEDIKLVDLVAQYAIPSEILPYFTCGGCDADFWIRPCADLDWSKHGFEYPDMNVILDRNDSVRFGMDCNCDGKPNALFGTEISQEFSVFNDGVRITESRQRIIKTRPYITTLERSRVVIHLKCDKAEELRHSLINFLHLPMGFD